MCDSTTTEGAGTLRKDTVVLIECNIDDMTGEALGDALVRILEAGALDAWFTPIQMKKNRPATMLSVLSRPTDAERLSEMILRLTTTLGVRWRKVERRIAERRIETVETAWGPVRVKTKLVRGEIIGAKPEFDDCARIARERGLTLAQVTREIERVSSISRHPKALP